MTTRPSRRFLVVMTVFGLHFTASVLAIFFALGSAMATLDTGSQPGFGERVFGGVASVILYPVFVGAADLFQANGSAAPPGWQLLLVNSAVWTVGIFLLFRAIDRTRAARPGG